MNIKIEKNVPITESKSGFKKGHKISTVYPFSDMDIGDSFVVPGGKKEQSHVCSAANRWSRRHSGKFTTRREGETVRCWRIA